MSTFARRSFHCPHCSGTFNATVAVSVHAERRPDLRDAILAGTFQKTACPHCQKTCTIQESFLYTDFGRQQWIACFHPSLEQEWKKVESESVQSWKTNALENAPVFIRDRAQHFRVRSVFGIPALREKLLCFEHHIDDTWLAVLALNLLRTPGSTFHPSQRPRLTGVRAEELEFHIPQGVLRVPRQRLDELISNPEPWKQVFDLLNAGPYVDVGRLMIGQNSSTT